MGGQEDEVFFDQPALVQAFSALVEAARCRPDHAPATATRPTTGTTFPGITPPRHRDAAETTRPEQTRAGP